MKDDVADMMKDVAVALGVSSSRGLEAEVKAYLTKALIREIEKRGLTHQQWRRWLTLLAAPLRES